MGFLTLPGDFKAGSCHFCRETQAHGTSPAPSSSLASQEGKSHIFKAPKEQKTCHRHWQPSLSPAAEFKQG